MARFSKIPLAEVGPPPKGAVFASTYNDAVRLIEDVYSGNLKVIDTTLENFGEGVLEHIQDDSDEMPIDGE